MSGQQQTPSTGKSTARKPGVSAVPKGYHTVTPYLIVDGGTKLLDFLTRALDAKVSSVMKMPDGKVGHAEVKIGDSFLMISDSMPGQNAQPTMLYLYVEDADAAFKKALGAGATQVQEIKDQFYGDRAGCFKDPSGNTWWLATHIEDVPPEELEKRAKQSMQATQQKH